MLQSFTFLRPLKPQLTCNDLSYGNAKSLTHYEKQKIIKHINTKSGVLVVSYEALRNEYELLRRVTWDHCILDEAQKIKNSKSQVYAAAIGLKAHHKLVLSGTPLQNNLQELWSLFSFVQPGLLGDLPFFEKKFVATIMAGGFSKATEM